MRLSVVVGISTFLLLSACGQDDLTFSGAGRQTPVSTATRAPTTTPTATTTPRQ